MSISLTLIRRSVATGAMLLLASFASQAAEFIVNGDFSANTGPGQLTVNSSVTGWTGGGKEGTFGSPTTPPVFLFPSSGGSVAGDAFMGNVSFYGNPQSPTGDYFIAADGDSDWAGSISQTVTGLTVGTEYTLTFNWAGAQQTGFAGDTTEKWRVTFGSDIQTTTTVNTPSQSFIGWQTATMTFTATSTSQLLSFLAEGTPNGQPPWLLLNGVSLTDTPVSSVPEPASALMMTVGLLGVGGLRLRARRRTGSAD